MNLTKSILASLGLLILIIGFYIITDQTDSSSGATSTTTTIDEEDSTYTESSMVNDVLYPHDSVIDVNIDINESTYNQLIANAIDESEYQCNITYNGYTVNNVAIRAKGNSSLRDVYQSGGDRFSFNIDLNYYIDQDLFGIDKIILNNLYNDPSMMAEYIGYEAYASLDEVSSRTTFVALSINGEYYGLYLSVESVNNEFLDTNYGNSDGELYKPEMGTGADLSYISDNITDYKGLVNRNADETDTTDILDLINAIDNGENIDDILDVDSFLKYLAVATYTTHLDSYQGGMYHNYYLYENNGVFEWIPWDLNMIFNGFPGARLTDEQATQFLIDEPVVGSMDNYPIVQAILSNSDYLARYHQYLQDLMDNYFNTETFTNRVTEIYNMINSYVQSDPSSFYSYIEFKNALFTDSTDSYSLIQYVELRNTNIAKQLSGELPSTNDGNGNVVDTTTQPNNPNGGLPTRPNGPGGMLPGIDPTLQDPTNATSATSSSTTISYSSLLPSIAGVIGILLFSYILSRKKF